MARKNLRRVYNAQRLANRNSHPYSEKIFLDPYALMFRNSNFYGIASAQTHFGNGRLTEKIHIE
jgi:hypothetical protein